MCHRKPLTTHRFCDYSLNSPLSFLPSSRLPEQRCTKMHVTAVCSTRHILRPSLACPVSVSYVGHPSVPYPTSIPAMSCVGPCHALRPSVPYPASVLGMSCVRLYHFLSWSVPCQTSVRAMSRVRAYLFIGHHSALPIIIITATELSITFAAEERTYTIIITPTELSISL